MPVQTLGDTSSESGSGDDSGTPIDTGTYNPLDFSYGDPIDLVNTVEIGGESDWHIIDVVALDDNLALIAGEGGFGIVKMVTATRNWFQPHRRIYDLAWDPSLEHAYLGTRVDGVDVIDLSNRDEPLNVGSMLEWLGYHEDVAANAGRVLVAAPQTGAVLLDGESLAPLSTIAASWASAVGLHADRAVVGDANEIVLYDIRNPASPKELDRVSVRATARDIEFNGEHIGVALGGHGVAVLRVEDDTLVLRAELDLPGTSYGVALDGDELWASTWSEVALIWLGGGEPLVLGTEPVVLNTLGLTARGGRAVAADWLGVTAFVRTPGVAGPELVVPQSVWSDGADPPTASVKLSNYGAMTLKVQPSVEDGAESVSADRVVLRPGESATVVITGEKGQELRVLLNLATNDPDELEASVAARTGEQSVGLPHEDLVLEGYVYPDTNLEPYRLSDQTGRVVFLAYFAVS